MNHEAKVARVAAQLSKLDGSKPVSLRKRAVSHVVPKRHDRRRTDDKIDISDLDELLAIDRDAMTATAEPGVTFADLVAATLRVGLVPTVVPELKTITVGGAVSGCSLESMSFQHGGFHDSCLEYEVITSTGEVLRCTPANEHSDVFQMMHGSFGTLGVLSKLTFKLVPAKSFVHVVYRQHSELASYQREIRAHVAERDVDFMDAFIHAPDHHTLCLGTFVDRASYTHRYGWMKVYYKTTATRREDYLRTEDYLFRYDNGVTNPTPKSALARLLFGKFLHSARVLRIAEKMPFLLPSKQPAMTLDVFVPMSRMEEFLAWHTESIGHFPLWCVPYRIPRRYEWASDEFWAGVNEDLFVDLAIYGLKQPPGRNLYKEVEDELRRVNGIKTLISYNYYDQETFWSIWDKPRYLAVKNRTDPKNVFRDLYSKTCRAALGLDDVKLAS